MEGSDSSHGGIDFRALYLLKLFILGITLNSNANE